MAVDGSKQHRVSATPPPRSLDVYKFAESRASELKTLHSIVANRLDNDFRSRRSKRRRTTGYDNRVAKNRHRKRQKFGVVDSANAAASDKGPEKVPRRIRRRIELRKNAGSGYSTSGDGTKRLRTHVWHAKRFIMTKLWGFHLPLGLHGRGRGSRALLKRFKDGVLIHDASYYGAVQLEGPQSSKSDYTSHSVLSGAIYGTAMLHHVGAPLSPAVAPVTYMWRSLQRKNVVDADNHDVDGCSDLQGIEGHSVFRQLWIWIHGSAFNEGYDVLNLACQKLMDEIGFSINCLSLEGKLANLDLMGSKSFQLLHKILHPVTGIAENAWQLCKGSDMESGVETCLKKFSIIENDHHNSSSAIISVTVRDPRGLPNEKVGLVPGETSACNLGNMREDEAKKFSSLSGITSRSIEVLSPSLSKLEEDSALSDNMNLWDASKGIRPPMEDNVLCMEKHHQRLAFFCLGNAKFGMQNASTDGPFSKSCPIVLMNRSRKDCSLSRWSVILPLSWVKVFWLALVSEGACAIGLREKHWVASEVGLPCFPPDFPDCNAYSCFMATKVAAFDEEVKLRPPAMRPVRVPIPPPWASVRLSFHQKTSTMKDIRTHCEEPYAVTVVKEKSSTNSVCGQSDTVARRHHGCLSDGFVARKSSILNNFLGEMHGDHLLLFPYLPDRKNSIAKFIKEKGRHSQGLNLATTLMNNWQRLCFLRVILQAYQGGVFEEGAVICAPNLSDITLLIPRSEDDKEELQIREAAVQSYFEQQPSGMWELQIPGDPIAQELHRWPIGFVTTGFVRGSKKPSAQALCDATLLTLLREEQWNAIPVKQWRKEIYVLVRNLRSTAYRLALATIVLEQQEDDLVFM